MPIEQVKEMLGHSQIDTTLIYAQVSQRNVKISHEKYFVLAIKFMWTHYGHKRDINGVHNLAHDLQDLQSVIIMIQL